MAEMKQPDKLVSEFIGFLSESVSPFHAVTSARRILADRGFRATTPDVKWELDRDDRFIVSLGDGALVAVKMARESLAERGCVAFAAHTDSPTLRIKEQGISWRKGYMALPTEKYGGPILSSWLDRELGIAGRAVTRDGTVMLVDLPERCVIPNLAIHLNRKVNEGFSYNAHDHMVAIGGVKPGSSGGASDSSGSSAEKADASARDRFVASVARAASVGPEDVWECELNLYDLQDPLTVGWDSDMIVGPRVDNLIGAFTSLKAFLEADSERPTILVLYNHEEIGNMSGEGAQSSALRQVIERIVSARGGTPEDAMVGAARSLLVSNDVAHALHPSFADKYDADYAPVLNGGPVLKMSSTLRYATTAPTGVLFRKACEIAGVPMQRLAMRSDMRAGTTVGPVTWARTGIPTVDVGVGILAMHSVRETAGFRDLDGMIRSLKAVAEL